MEKRKLSEKLSVMEAVDNLSSLAEIDISRIEIPIDKDLRGEDETGPANWLDPAHVMKNRDTVRATFRAIHHYLEQMYEKDKGHLKDADTQKGIQAIMVLAGEAAQKIDKYTSLFKEANHQESVTELKEYKDLQEFYLNKIMKRFHETLEAEEEWQKEWGNLEEDELDVEKRSLKDLETVRRDKEYELFYIKKENGHPFFKRDLLRHIRMVGEFDESLAGVEGEDPILKLHEIHDRVLHESAKEMIASLRPNLDEFYKEAMKHKDNPLVSLLNKAIMALMLAANGRNLLSSAQGKSSLNYFSDSHLFLREALSSDEYERFMSNTSETSMHFGLIVINLLHSLCLCFFTRTSRKKEILEFIQEMVERRKKEMGWSEEIASISIWNTLFDEDEALRAMLKRFPSGPLLKTLDLFREGEEKKGFDPLSQGNYPSHLFTSQFDQFHLSVLRLPSPTNQVIIDKAQVVPEFFGFLRGLKTEMKGQKILLINLQDKTTWNEHARASALEKIQNQAEFADVLTVVTLAKNSDFYHQIDHYQNLTDAQQFISQFNEQIASGPACGYFFPAQIPQEEILRFTQGALQLIHAQIFSSKAELSRKNRLDFIEIFYYFLIVKLLMLLKPDCISFTCKDAIDTGEAASAGFYAFLRMMSSNKPWAKEEKELMQWILYFPALLVRERLIDVARFSRTISALSILGGEIETRGKPLKDSLDQLYGQSLFTQIQLKAA